LILAFLATLGAVVVAFVLYPVFASKAPEPIGLDATQSELRDLEEKKTQILSNIKDLDFEKASGKLTDADYESSRNDYMAQVSAMITRMGELAPQQQQERKKRGSAASKRTAAESKAETIACASCGEANPKGSKFCLDCGRPFEARCGACRETLPKTAKFCNACGEKVSA
jgi:rRNA maturation endonuclease Nob1